MTLDGGAVAAFLLVLSRTSAWVIAAPVFSARGLSSVGRLALAIALSLFLAPLTAPHLAVPSDVAPFAVLVFGQVLVGLLLGWSTGLLLHAFEAAGAMIDITSGLSISTLIDPLSGSNNALFARFFNLLFVTLMVVGSAHHTLLTGFVRSFDAVPADALPMLGGDAFGSVGHAVGGMVLAAFEIGAPVLGALFLTEVALALAARFAPQANVFVVGLPVKVMVALLVMGSVLVFLPARLDGLLDASLRVADAVLSR